MRSARARVTWQGVLAAAGRSSPVTEVVTSGATDMEMPDGKERQPAVDISEAALWFLRSKAKYLQADEMQEFSSWLRRSPENAAALLTLAKMDRRVVPRRRSTSRFKQALTGWLRWERAETQTTTKHRALSLSYLKHVRQKHFLPKIGLLAVAVCGVAGWMFLGDVRPLKIAVVSFVCFLLLMVREAVIGFRVMNGYFGSTESEVRDFVEFIAAHRGDIDFTDQGGRRRPSLVPEPPQTNSAPAPTGVWSE